MPASATPDEGGGASAGRGPSEMAQRPFVRPPAEEIDFVRVVRRSDLSRRAAHVARTALLLAGAGLVAYLLLPVAVVLVVTGVAAITSVVAGVVRWHLDGAAVPRLRR